MRRCSRTIRLPAPASAADRCPSPTALDWASGGMTERYAQIALPLPLASSYTYRIPETLGDRVVTGARVVVPVRQRQLVGIAVAVDTPPPAAVAREHLQQYVWLWFLWCCSSSFVCSSSIWKIVGSRFCTANSAIRFRYRRSTRLLQRDHSIAIEMRARRQQPFQILSRSNFDLRTSRSLHRKFVHRS